MKNITTLSAILGATAFALSMPTAFADTLEQDRLANETVDNSNTIEEVLVSAHPLSGEGLAQAMMSCISLNTVKVHQTISTLRFITQQQMRFRWRYTVYMSGNGGSYTNTFTTNATIASGDVYVVSTNQADSLIQAEADTVLG